jgi:hypothetical protein
MFELIGLLFATMLLFVLAAVLSGITWLLVRKTSAPRKRLIFAAASIPIISAAYFWLCIALLPGESLSGDISQPLPNGYLLEALGKMPDFASISNPKSPNSYNGLSECISQLAVYGPLVAGQYSHPFGTEVQFFRSQEPAYRARQNVNKVVMFGPPIIALGIFTAYVLRNRLRTQPSPPNIYT